jgi:DNA mismatch endonuclease (patch repair protein)
MTGPRNQSNLKRPLTRSEIMGRVGSKNSAAERSLRVALHAEGLRFRLHRRVDGVSADIVFPGARVLVFVDGCFWHGCPRHATFPKTNTGYWLPKLEENKERDKRQTDRLRKAGWKVIRIWEHDCLPPTTRAIARVLAACRKGDARR